MKCSGIGFYAACTSQSQKMAISQSALSSCFQATSSLVAIARVLAATMSAFSHDSPSVLTGAIVTHTVQVDRWIGTSQTLGLRGQKRLPLAFPFGLTRAREAHPLGSMRILAESEIFDRNLIKVLSPVCAVLTRVLADGVFLFRAARDHRLQRRADASALDSWQRTRERVMAHARVTL